jgi:hypothetical protein
MRAIKAIKSTVFYSIIYIVVDYCLFFSDTTLIPLKNPVTDCYILVAGMDFQCVVRKIILHAHVAISRFHSLELWTGRLSVAYGMCSDKIFIQLGMLYNDSHGNNSIHC